MKIGRYRTIGGVTMTPGKVKGGKHNDKKIPK